MALLMALARWLPIFRQSNKVRPVSSSGWPASFLSYKANNVFAPAEKVTKYREIPQTDLASLWLQNCDPSLLQDPETVSGQVASLTEFAAETLKRLSELEQQTKVIVAALSDVNERVGKLERLNVNYSGKSAIWPGDYGPR